MNAATLLYPAVAARIADDPPVYPWLIAWDAMGGPPFTPPAQDPSDPSESIWIRPSVTVAPISGRPRALGLTSQTRHDGLIEVQGFAPAGSGLADLMGVMDDVATVMSRAAFSGIQTRDATPGTYERAPDHEGWWQSVVQVPYYMDVDVTLTVMGGSSVNLRVVSASHGFSVGEWLRYNGSAWELAQADDATTCAEGIVTKASTDQFTVSSAGIQTITHGLGTSGPIYLSQGSAGVATVTRPTSGVIQELGSLAGATLLVVNIGPVLEE